MIKLLILDIDGVMTDGTKIYGLDGLTMAKRYCDRDFTAIKQFKASGVSVCFLSGDDKVNKEMAKSRDKVDFLDEFENTYNCSRDEMAYVGDDIFDMPIMKAVGYSYCPSDVTETVKTVAHKVLDRKSGDNVIADLYEKLVELGLVGYSTLEDIKELDKLESF